jgi:hypothetical protein
MQHKQDSVVSIKEAKASTANVAVTGIFALRILQM